MDRSLFNYYMLSWVERNQSRKFKMKMENQDRCESKFFLVHIASSQVDSQFHAHLVTLKRRELSIRVIQRSSLPLQTLSVSKLKTTTTTSCLVAMVSMTNWPIPRWSRRDGRLPRNNSKTGARLSTKIVERLLKPYWNHLLQNVVLTTSQSLSSPSKTSERRSKERWTSFRKIFRSRRTILLRVLMISRISNSWKTNMQQSRLRIRGRFHLKQGKKAVLSLARLSICQTTIWPCKMWRSNQHLSDLPDYRNWPPDHVQPQMVVAVR